ncbi:MAG: signal peptide peptidase SppA [Candidatus Melainabacteria bacterium]|nr:signal peptide peptidase SppA [Candidatus Melainabacteria bacterium]
MNAYNKNISTIIILICIICIIWGIFLPKNNIQSNPIENRLEKDSYLSINPKTLHSPFKGEKISVIKLEGVISDSNGTSIFKDITSSNSVLDLLIKATNDPSVKAIVIRINSPGGTVAASQELYQAVLKARKKKPVVITMGDIAASGGYYIASAADAIFANPGTLTGSIGVISSYLNFYDLLNKIGVKGIVIKSGEYKDIGNPTRPLTDKERKILQAILDDSYKQFLNDVARGRNIPVEKIALLAEGLIYTGAQAKKVGLVDYLGDYNKAIRFTQKLAKKRFPELARKYKKSGLPIEETWKETSIFDMLLGVTNKMVNYNVLDNKILKTYSYSKFQPLWLLE